MFIGKYQCLFEIYFSAEMFAIFFHQTDFFVYKLCSFHSCCGEIICTFLPELKSIARVRQSEEGALSYKSLIENALVG
jgi:hypothetical protein